MVKRVLPLLILLALASLTSVYAQDGEALLSTYSCNSCHKMDKVMTGPALIGAVERWGGDKEEMKKFIKAGYKAYVDGGGKNASYIKGVRAEVNDAVMVGQNVPDADLDAILAYIETYEPPVATTGGGDGGTGETATAGGGGAMTSDTMLYGLIMLVGLLVLISIVLIVVIAAVLSAIRAKERGDKITYGSLKETAIGVFKSPFAITLVALIVLGGVADKGYEFVSHIGFHDGYQPVQPVAFSHKLHAGQYEIDCKYCHVGADKSKNATIPSTNICMNCHNVIKEGPKYKEVEIAKVRQAHADNKPIEWVRIHNLPDLVYFNHSQHVKVGGLECQTCHGPVQEMEEVYQYSRLTMAWCINCHKNKAVKFNENGYYQHVYHSVRADMQESGVDSVTVARLGGMECSRCHY